MNSTGNRKLALTKKNGYFPESIISRAWEKHILRNYKINPKQRNKTPLAPQIETYSYTAVSEQFNVLTDLYCGANMSLLTRCELILLYIHHNLFVS